MKRLKVGILLLLSLMMLHSCSMTQETYGKRYSKECRSDEVIYNGRCTSKDKIQDILQW